MSEIRQLRTTHAITQLELAGALGVSRSAVSRMEHETPRPEALERALQAIEAILEFRRLWAASPSASMEDWLRIVSSGIPWSGRPSRRLEILWRCWRRRGGRR